MNPRSSKLLSKAFNPQAVTVKEDKKGHPSDVKHRVSWFGIFAITEEMRRVY